MGKERDGDTPECGRETLKDYTEREGAAAHALTSGSTSALLLQMFSHTNLSCRFYKHAKENGALASTGLSDHPLLGLSPLPPPVRLPC